VLVLVLLDRKEVGVVGGEWRRVIRWFREEREVEVRLGGRGCQVEVESEDRQGERMLISVIRWR
jgi:hypothetical protein